ncbi:MAG: ATP-dependent helicase HrpB [bacterium]
MGSVQVSDHRQVLTLPIESVLPAIRETLASHRALVLQAPPGAGKTTLVPPALLDSAWLGERSIVMLEPRRLATRAAAYRIAELRGEAVGNTVGYRMRGDTRVGRQTRIEVVTEGILTRRLQRDPTLDGVGLVIFDEFHERSLDADLGLALTLRTQQLVRDDLRIIVMSATLDGSAVSRLLGDAPVITSHGRVYPVDTRYVEPRSGARIEASIAAAIGEALRSEPGDILVFLPGAGEIRRVESLLGERSIGDAMVLPLYGAMTHDAQDRAIRPDPGGRRKIVLATSIAETSLTIEGVRVVIDSGLSRVPRFSPRTGMTRLDTVRVSVASADQRRGRAGRLGPGVCYRLWPEHENSHLLASTSPEITSADLAPLALDLAAAGVRDPLELSWIDAPPPSAFAQALELLRELDAVDSDGNVTAQGRDMNALPVHPRLGHMLLRARSLGVAPLACDMAALLSERDVLRGAGGGGAIDADIALRIEALQRDDAPRSRLIAGADVDRDAVRRARTEADRLARQLGVDRHDRSKSTDMIGTLVALAYPDRVGQRRPGTRARFVLRNGRGAELEGAQSLSESAFIVATELDDRRPESRVFLAAPISLDEIRETFSDQIRFEDVVEFDDATSSIVSRRRERLGAITLRDVSFDDPDPEQIRGALLAAIRRRGVSSLPWPEPARRLRERVAFLRHLDPEWPDLSDDALAARLDEWLGPSLTGVRRLNAIDQIDLTAALMHLIDWKQRRALDDLAPTHVEVPSGSRIPVDYSDPAAPVLAVRIQEVFGLMESPRLANGRVPVTMHLLSPAHRPVQVTRDLGGFWRTSYFDVRKDLRGRYPKHEWPEDPIAAPPTRRAKPRGT